jgi:hypothetical protein
LKDPKTLVAEIFFFELAFHLTIHFSNWKLVLIPGCKPFAFQGPMNGKLKTLVSKNGALKAKFHHGIVTTRYDLDSLNGETTIVNKSNRTSQSQNKSMLLCLRPTYLNQ